MNISQEVSQADKSVPLVNGNPAISQRKLAAQVAVQSGQTVLLGGLIEQAEGNTDTGIPGLNRIPILGRDRKSVGEGKSVSVRVDLGGRRSMKKKKKKKKTNSK